MCGLRDEIIQCRLLTMKKLTFQVASETAIAMEMACQSKLAFRAPPTAPVTQCTGSLLRRSVVEGRDLSRWRKENPSRKANVIFVVMTINTNLSLQEECVPQVPQSGAFGKKMS